MDAAPQRRVILLAPIGLFALANLFVPGLFWVPSISDLKQYVAFFCAGGAVAEVCLAAIWGAMAAQQAKYRIPVSAGLVLLAACSYILGLQIPDFPDSDMPLSLAVVLIGLSIAMYLVLLLPLWIVRRLAHVRIAVPMDGCPRAPEPGSSQFGMRYLLMGPVAVSVVFFLLHCSLPENRDTPQHLSRILEVLLAASAFIALSMLICIPCVWLALSEGRRWPWGLVLMVVWFLGPWGVHLLISMLFGASNMLEAIVGTGAFGSGVLLTTLAVLFLLRLLGYRLISPRPC